MLRFETETKAEIIGEIVGNVIWIAIVVALMVVVWRHAHWSVALTITILFVNHAIKAMRDDSR